MWRENPASSTSTGRPLKIGFEKYFIRKMRRGETEPFYERFVLDRLNIGKIKEIQEIKELKTGT